MHADRLLKLADLLEADADNKKGIKFDLGHWGSAKVGRIVKNDAETLPISCHTKACALGLAALSGAFSEFGLSYEIMNRTVWDNKLQRAREVMEIEVIYHGEDGEINTGYGAASELFDITSRWSEYLFSPFRYHPLKTRGKRAERAVAQRIRILVANHQEEEEGK